MTENNKHRLWVHQIETNNSLEQIDPDKHMYGNSKCAICREFLTKTCTRCRSDTDQIDKEHIEKYTEELKEIWKILLMLRNRKNTLFSNLDINVTACIYKHAIKLNSVQTKSAVDCDITILKCKHVYHSCCLSSWTQRHSSCPLCSKFIEPNTNQKLYNIKYDITGKVTKVLNTKYTAAQYKQNKKDAAIVPAKIVNILKHHIRGFPKQILFELTCDAFKREIEPHIFENSINYLIQQKFVYYNQEKDRFIYIP